MDYLEYALDLTDEQREIRDTAHRFARDVMRPAGIASAVIGHFLRWTARSCP